MSAENVVTGKLNGTAITRFPLELLIEEFETRFSSLCQAWVYRKIGLKEKTNLEGLLGDMEEDLESLLSTAPQKFDSLFRKRAIVIARRSLVHARETFKDDEEIRKLITLKTI